MQLKVYLAEELSVIAQAKLFSMFQWLLAGGTVEAASVVDLWRVRGESRVVILNDYMYSGSS